MNIGILGLLFNSANKGCEALAYSFLGIMDEIAARRNTKITITIFGDISINKLFRFPWDAQKYKSNILPRNLKLYKNLYFQTIFYVSAKGQCLFLNKCYCDCVFDYTQGDSFTDIYGAWRFYYFSSVKRKIIKKRIPLILGSQTIGPFIDKRIKEYAEYIIKNSSKIFVRDELSYQYTLENFNIKPVLTTDIAFTLPYKKKEITSKRIKVGINVSGLLWNEENLNSNNFGLSVDYREYCRKLISALTKEGKYEVHLIAHVIVSLPGCIDDDKVIISKMHEEFPDTIEAPAFNTPMEAKSYISAMDVFTGARMHATIAAFSSGVPVVPFSYSRKFEGLFNSLQYPFVIHGKEEKTLEALNRTLDYIKNKTKLKERLDSSLIIAKDRMEKLYIETEKFFL